MKLNRKSFVKYPNAALFPVAKNDLSRFTYEQKQQFYKAVEQYNFYITLRSVITRFDSFILKHECKDVIDTLNLKGSTFYKYMNDLIATGLVIKKRSGYKLMNEKKAVSKMFTRKYISKNGHAYYTFFKIELSNNELDVTEWKALRLLDQKGKWKMPAKKNIGTVNSVENGKNGNNEVSISYLSLVLGISLYKAAQIKKKLLKYDYIKVEKNCSIVASMTPSQWYASRLSKSPYHFYDKFTETVFLRKTDIITLNTGTRKPVVEKPVIVEPSIRKVSKPLLNNPVDLVTITIDGKNYTVASNKVEQYMAIAKPEPREKVKRSRNVITNNAELCELFCSFLDNNMDELISMKFVTNNDRRIQERSYNKILNAVINEGSEQLVKTLFRYLQTDINSLNSFQKKIQIPVSSSEYGEGYIKKGYYNLKPETVQYYTLRYSSNHSSFNKYDEIMNDPQVIDLLSDIL